MTHSKSKYKVLIDEEVFLFISPYPEKYNPIFCLRKNFERHDDKYICFWKSCIAQPNMPIDGECVEISLNEAKEIINDKINAECRYFIVKE